MSRTTSLELRWDVEAAVHPTVAFQGTWTHLTVRHIYITYSKIFECIIISTYVSSKKYNMTIWNEWDRMAYPSSGQVALDGFPKELGGSHKKSRYQEKTACVLNIFDVLNITCRNLIEQNSCLVKKLKSPVVNAWFPLSNHKRVGSLYCRQNSRHNSIFK